MKNVYKIILLSVFAILIAACGDDREETINGDWLVFSGPSLSDTYNYYITFNDGNVYITTQMDGELTRDTCATGNYVLKNTVLTIAAPRRSCHGLTYDGDWNVEKLEENVLVINQNVDGQRTLELTKN